MQRDMFVELRFSQLHQIGMIVRNFGKARIAVLIIGCSFAGIFGAIYSAVSKPLSIAGATSGQAQT